MQPVHYHVTDAALSGTGVSPTDFACLTQLERQLIILHSLAARKYELSASSPAGYEPWESSYLVWKEEGYKKMLEDRLLVSPSIEREIRGLPEGEKEEYTARYATYIKWLNQMTGNDNDPIPEEVLIQAIGSIVFPEIPARCRDENNNTYSCPSLKALCLGLERKKAS